jgi:hypothetical protein
LPNALTAVETAVADVGPELVEAAVPGPIPLETLSAPPSVLPLTVIPPGVDETLTPKPGALTDVGEL